MIALVILAAASGVSATRTCGYDFYGYYRCSGLPNGARLGIGIGIAALSIFVLLSLIVLRRRRIRQTNQSFIAHPNTGQYQQQYRSHPQHPLPNQPQPSYNPSYQHYNQGNPNQTGAWNSGNYPPPQQSQFAPPPGPPPPVYTPQTKEHV